MEDICSRKKNSALPMGLMYKILMAVEGKPVVVIFPYISIKPSSTVARWMRVFKQ